MKLFNSGCILCGKKLIYFEKEKKLQCQFCKNEFMANASCEDGHFICDQCHMEKGYEIITDLALSSEEHSPLNLALKMMKNPFINIHGPEHHYLVPACLLSAYKNTVKDFDLQEGLLKARQRAEKVPGGICGFWGSCGAGIGTGIFISIITEATPLSYEPWGKANYMTSLSLNAIARNGGPRCCKRNSFLSLIEAVNYLKESFGIDFNREESIKCPFFMKNKECRKEECTFYPYHKAL